MKQTTSNGYRKRPWELTVLAVFFALVPALSWATRYVSSVLVGRPESFPEVLAGFFAPATYGPIGVTHSVLMATLWVLFLVVAWGIFRVVKWGFALCIVAAVANSLFSMVLYRVGTGDSGLQEALAFNPFQLGVALNLIFFIPVIVVLRQKLMAPFFNPRLKWWEQNPRVKALLRIEATIADQVKTYQSFDISGSGMFLGTQEFPDVPVGGFFPATIYLDEISAAVEVRCEAVWISDGKGRMPMGVGVTFRYPKPGQKRVLGRYIQSKIREGQQLERV